MFILFQRDQLADHEERVTRLENELEEHQKMPPEKGSKSLTIQNYKERDVYLSYEVSTYILLLTKLVCRFHFS